MKLSISLLLLLLLWLQHCTISFAQPQTLQEFTDQLHFVEYTEEDGLYNGYVTSIFEDSLGFMWLGTANGISRFDGYAFEHFPSYEDDSTTLSHNNVWSIAGGNDNTLWVGTAEGLNRLDPVTNIVTQFKNSIFSDSSLSNNFVRRLFRDGKGHLWVGTNNGLNRLRDAAGSFEQLAHSPHISRLVRSIAEDNQQRIWFAVNDTLYLHRDGTEKFPAFPLPRPAWLEKDTHLNIRLLYYHSDSLLWIGTDNAGLYGFDINKMAYVHHFAATSSGDTPPALDSQQINALCMDRDGRLWIGTMNGLHLLDLQSDTVARHHRHPADPEYLNFKEIWSLYEDRQGNMWLGTFYGGVKVWLRNRKHFRMYAFSENDPLRANGTLVQAFTIDAQDNLWTIVNRTSLARFNKQTNRLEAVAHNVPSNNINYVTVDSKNRQWINTDDVGLWMREASNGPFHSVIDRQSPCFPLIISIYESESGDLWIGNTNGVICNYQPETGELYVYRLDESSQILQGKSNDFVEQILQTRDGTIWAATYGGLNQFVPAEQKFRFIESPSQIVSIYESSTGNLWVGTSDGMYYYNEHSHKIQRYESGQLSDFREVITGITEDKEGRLWFMSTGDLLCYDLVEDSLNRYTRKEGVDILAFGSFTDPDGNLYFGSSKGFLWFNPEKLVSNPIPPPVSITDIKINNEPVPLRSSVGDTMGHPSPLIKNIRYTRTIELAYNQNDVSFEFTALDFTLPENNLYKYKLEGNDQNWITVDAGRRFANYTNLQPGEYTFRVIAANNDGIWNEAGTSLLIRIFPPIWRTWYAYTLYVLLAIGTIALLARSQRNRLITREREAASIREAHLIAQAATERARLAEQLEETKNRFFINLSHEFRTPLTLLLGPICDAMDGAYGALDNRLQTQLDSMHRNGKRLHQLINQLLDLARLESGSLHLEARSGDLVAFVKALTLSFASRAERENKTLKFESSSETISLYFDRDKLEKIICNLLSNAFKFTPAKSLIHISIEQTATEAAIIVSDTGEGIPAAELPHIFNRFHQVDASLTRKFEGSGIGLALAKELVELHHGQIMAESEPDAGSKFTVLLPLGKAHLNAQDFIMEEDEATDELNVEPVSTNRRPSKLIDSPVTKSNFLTQQALPTNATILIVEDNADVRTYLKSHLGNYRVEEAIHGLEGLQKAKAIQPDLIISDVMMPEMDGLALCRALKQDKETQDIPVILLTAKAAEENKIEGLAMGADEYLYKPFSAKELLVRTENLIYQRRRLRKQYSQEIILKPSDIVIDSEDKIFVEKITSIVDANLGESQFNAERLATEAGLSQRQLQRRIKTLLKKTPTAFIRDMRLERAAYLLQHRAGNVSEIMYQVGYRDLRHFSRLFKSRYGCSPSVFSSQNNNL